MPFAGNKFISVADAAAKVVSGDDVVLAMAASEPQTILKNLHLGLRDKTNIRIFSCLLLRPYEFFMNPEFFSKAELCSWFHGTAARSALKEGANVTFVPNMLHRAATDRLAVKRPDVFLGTCTPPDRHGFVSLSLGITYEKDILEAAKTVILEVNEQLPRTFGDTHVHVDDVDFFVEGSMQPPMISAPPPEEAEKRIGEYVADLIEDGSTIQLGIGGIPNAVALALTSKKDLGVHTEMMVDSMVDLYESGAVNNHRKSYMKDKFVCAFALGSKRLYDWLDGNVAVEFQRGRLVNDPALIRKNSRMVSLNTCLMLDFAGQVASESIGSRQYSGTGGQTDTAIGAVEGLDGLGKSIIACRSTAQGGKSSTLVPVLPEGSQVTLHRANVDYVVTEFGVAHLRGRTIRERTKSLIAIAHPDFREELTGKAKFLGYV